MLSYVNNIEGSSAMATNVVEGKVAEVKRPEVTSQPLFAKCASEKPAKDCP